MFFLTFGNKIGSIGSVRFDFFYIKPNQIDLNRILAYWLVIYLALLLKNCPLMPIGTYSTRLLIWLQTVWTISLTDQLSVRKNAKLFLKVFQKFGEFFNFLGCSKNFPGFYVISFIFCIILRKKIWKKVLEKVIFFFRTLDQLLEALLCLALTMVSELLVAF